MRKRLFFKNTGHLTVAAALTAVFLSFGTVAQSTGRQVLQNSQPRAVSHLEPTGRLAGGTRMNLAISLPLRNKAALDDLVQQIYDPTSPNYRQYLTPEQFTEQFGPTESDYQVTENFFRANGFAITGEHASRMVLDVSGTVADVERAFHVNMRTYAHPTENRSFFAPDTEPSLDLSVPILQVSGLDNYAVRRSRISHKTPLDKLENSTTNPATGSGPAGAYMGKDFRNAYVPGVSLTGSGQTIGLVEFDAYYPGDITAYETKAGLAAIALTNIAVDGGVSSPGSGNGEVALDIDMSMSIAPGLSKIAVFEAPQTASWTDMLDALAGTLYKQFSCSWGDSAPGTPNTAAEAILERMESQGQSFFNASGDEDAFTNGVPFPSESLYVTQVGGTTLTTTGPGGAKVLETTWNWGGNGPQFGSYGSVGSSGGISKNFAIPSWQQGIGMSNNLGSTTMRDVPDVAMVADNVFIVADNGTDYDSGGTSCAAPLWAAIAALANQQAAANGKSSVGLINPAIYTAAKSANYLSVFDDITTGNNLWERSTNQFFAVSGYDLCTGLGTPVGDNLIDILAGESDSLGVAPGRGFVGFGPQGGPFTASGLNFSLTNTSASSINWSLVNTSLWLTASATSGTLSSDSATNVTVSLNAAADSLTNGIYTANVIFMNKNNSDVRTRQFTLLVGQSLIQNGGFEYSAYSFSYWSQTGTKTTYTWDFVDGPTNNGGSYTGVAPHSGQYVAILGPPGTNGYISQTVSTVPGQSYLLSFWVRNPKAATTQKFAAYWNTNTLLSLTNPAVFNWSNHVYYVTATSTNSVVEFSARGDSQHWFALDDVSLLPMAVLNTEINIEDFKIVPTNAVSLSWNSATGQVYNVQYSTNLASTNWFDLSTNTGTGSTMSFTNKIGANPYQFYRIRSP